MSWSVATIKSRYHFTIRQHIKEKVIEKGKQTKLVLTDTGATISHFPNSDYKKIIEHLCEGKNCVMEDGYYFIKNCDYRAFEPMAMWF